MERALQLYAAGHGYAAIVRSLALPKAKGGFDTKVGETTVLRWKETGQPHEITIDPASGAKLNTPRDWDALRSRLEHAAAEEAVRALEASRRKLAHVHYDDLEKLRQAVHQVLFEEKLDRRTGETTQIPRKLSAMNLKFLADAYAKIQVGQRTVFGQNAYQVGIGGADGAPAIPQVWLPPETDE
jgi:hypothetical protein